MDISKLTFNKNVIISSFRILPNGSAVATRPMVVCFPKRFEEAGYAEIYDKITCIGMVGIIVGNQYACLGVLASFTFLSADVSETLINGIPHYLLGFEEGETVIENMTVPVNPLTSYDFYIEFIKYARIPWYSTYEKVLAVMDEGKPVTGRSNGNSAQVLRVPLSLTCRDPDNPEIPFRYGKNLENPNKEPLIIGINNPGQLLTGTFARFSGGYLSDNTIAGIEETPSEMTALEEVLKGIPNE